MKLLMHTCCAPCSVYCIDSLRSEGIEPTVYWYNPNIHPYMEYKARRDCLKEYTQSIGVQAIFEEEYGLDEFCKNVIRNLKTRCTNYCYRVRLEQTAKYAKENGFGVIIAGAGMAAALAGVLAAHTTLPVIGVPLISAVLEGTDALLATVMMPSGIPVATVAIDGSKNAAYLAAEIIALSDESLAEKIAEDRKKQSEAVLKKDAGIQEKIKEL